MTSAMRADTARNALSCSPTTTSVGMGSDASRSIRSGVERNSSTIAHHMSPEHARNFPDSHSVHPGCSANRWCAGLSNGWSPICSTAAMAAIPSERHSSTPIRISAALSGSAPCSDPSTPPVAVSIRTSRSIRDPWASATFWAIIPPIE